MFNIKQWLVASMIIMNPFTSTLWAIKATTTFYPANHIPVEYQNGDEDADCIVIHTEGWENGTKVNIYEKRLDCEKKERKCYSVAEEGKVDMVVSSLGYVPGFPVTYYFKDSKNNIQKEIELISNRIYVKSPVDNAEIEATLEMTFPANYYIKFSGFQDNEKIFFISSSYDEKLTSDLIVTKSFLFSFMPGVNNKPGGIALLSFKRPSGEVLRLELPWGWEWLKYNMFYDDEGNSTSYIYTEEFRKNFPKEAEYFDSKLSGSS